MPLKIKMIILALLVSTTYPLHRLGAPALEQALGGEFLPAREIGEITYFTGIFKGGRTGESYGSSEYQYPAELANYVAPAVSVILLIALVAGSLTTAVLMTERKDVG